MSRKLILSMISLTLLAFTIFAVSVNNSYAEGITSDEIITKQDEILELPKEVYPFQVEDTEENGYKKIIKTYALSENESPEAINKQSFEKMGYKYVFNDLIKKESMNQNTVEHTEIIEINTATNNAQEIVSKLEPTVTYEKDGYSGILYLDISSLKTEVVDKKTNSYTVTKAREYPHLTSNDSSLIPKTIVDGGLTYTLTNVIFKTQETQLIDHEQIPVTYTAQATYSAKASSTNVTGYNTTVNYNGKITKTMVDRTIYTAIFISESPVFEVVELPEPEFPNRESSLIIENIDIGKVSEESDKTQSSNVSGTTKEKSDFKLPKMLLPILMILLIMIALIGLAILILKLFNKNTLIYNQNGSEFIKVKKFKVDYKSVDSNIFIDLNKIPKKKITSNNFIVEFSEKVTKNLNNRVVEIAYGDEVITHYVDKIDYRIYQIEANFETIPSKEGEYLA